MAVQPEHELDTALFSQLSGKIQFLLEEFLKSLVELLPGYGAGTCTGTFTYSLT